MVSACPDAPLSHVGPDRARRHRSDLHLDRGRRLRLPSDDRGRFCEAGLLRARADMANGLHDKVFRQLRYHRLSYEMLTINTDVISFRFQPHSFSIG